MTECERIIEENILPQSFFKEETRDGFFVDINRKKIWAICIDLLLEFDRVCKKNNLTYYLSYGTLLGAIRHKGFIPWDDDVDVMMPRNDYNKLISLYSEFKDPYFLQNPYTDKDCYFSYLKLRNKKTTYINTPFAFNNYCFGIMLDIFPIDNWIENGGTERHNKIKKSIFNLSTWMRKNNPNLSEKDLNRVKELPEIQPLTEWKKIQNIAQSFNDVKTDCVCSSCLTVYSLNKSVWKKVWFKDTVEVNFEGYTFPAPAKYDKLLTTIYGNYNIFPPKEERGNWHSNIYINPDKPYLEIINEYRKSLNK